MTFLMSQLANATFTSSIFGNFPGSFDPQRIALYGHSFGGAAAAVVLQRDARAIGGADLDGNVYGEPLYNGFKDKPFLLVSSEGIANSGVLNWSDFYPKINASKMELSLKDTQHNAFTDIPLLLEVSRLLPTNASTVENSFGTLSGRKVERAVDNIMAGVLELVFHNKTRALKNIGRDQNILVVHNDLRGCK